MAAFFVCIILIGSGITIFALILLLAEKHRLHDYRIDIKDKKNDLIKVIEDAEDLISEMNRYSDYVVTQIEDKHNALSKSIEDADLKIEFMNSLSNVKTLDYISPSYDEASVEKIIEEEQLEPAKSTNAVKKGKVLTFDLKRREIIKLAKSGLDSTEIARRLNCGKGEIELIAKLGRQP